jgi:hypothetical protein
MGLFCDAALAERIERMEAARVVAGAQPRGFAIAVGGGYATFAEPGSPLNKVVGVGFAGVPHEDDWDAVEHAFAQRGAAVHVELSHLGDPAIAAQLSARGYRLSGYENVLGRAVEPAIPPATPPGIEVRPSGDDELDVWIGVVMGGFGEPDGPRPEEFPHDVIERVVRDMATLPGVRRYLALVDGVPAGGASATFADGVAALTGAATLGPYRRRGIQNTLLARRVADAADAGCDVATVTTSPATKSQQNAQRQGFELLYTRVVLAKGAEGSP